MRPIPIIKPEIFSQFPGLIAGMSTRIGGISPSPLGLNLSFNVGDKIENVNKNRKMFYAALQIPMDRLAITRQVHGTTLAKVDFPGSYEATDGLITNTRGLYLSISTADCVPILLYDPQTRTIAAVHSGWRGTQSGILSDAVRVMINDYSAYLSDIKAWIGPAAGSCCYEIGEEVASHFASQYVIRQEGRKPRLDLKARLLHQLLDAGLAETNVSVSSECTIHNAEKFHSYRRDGSRSGRMAAVIGMHALGYQP